MVEPKPAKLPIWNTGGSNRTEPPSGNKTSGWAINEEPPSSWFNWLQHYTGAWFVWLDERLVEGTGEHDFIVQALTPDASGGGGALSLKAGDANTNGNGGSILATAGDAISGQGGDIQLFAGEGDTASGGDIWLKAGPGNSLGGDITLEGGSPAGTDKQGGNIFVATGTATGTGSASIEMKVSESGASGSAQRLPTDYVVMDGAAGVKTVEVKRYLNVSDNDLTRGNMTFQAKNVPTAPPTGDIYRDFGTNWFRYYNGARYANLNPVVYNVLANGTTGRHPSPPTTGDMVFGELPIGGGPTPTVPVGYRIPPNKLQAGTIIRITVAFETILAIAGAPFARVSAGNNILQGSWPYFVSGSLSMFAFSFNTAPANTPGFGTGELVIVSPGSPATVAVSYRATGLDNAGNPVIGTSTPVLDSTTIDTAQNLDIFAHFGFTATDQVEVRNFMIEII